MKTKLSEVEFYELLLKNAKQREEIRKKDALLIDKRNFKKMSRLLEQRNLLIYTYLGFNYGMFLQW
jgi:hypothetical protein